MMVSHSFAKSANEWGTRRVITWATRHTVQGPEDLAMIVYNLFPLLAGVLSNWEGHMKRAADMGFEWILVNPIQKSGRSGSLYSITDYFQINPRFLDPRSTLLPEQQVRASTETA